MHHCHSNRTFRASINGRILVLRRSEEKAKEVSKRATPLLIWNKFLPLVKIKREFSDSRCTFVQLYFLPLIAVVERDEYNIKKYEKKGKKDKQKAKERIKDETEYGKDGKNNNSMMTWNEFYGIRKWLISRSILFLSLTLVRSLAEFLYHDRWRLSLRNDVKTETYFFFYREDSINIAQNIKKKRNVKRKGEEKNTKIQRNEFNVVTFTKDGGETTKEACFKKKKQKFGKSPSHPLPRSPENKNRFRTEI